MSCIIVGRQKKYVAVDVRFEPDGHLRPLAIVFGPDQVYTIEQIKDVSRRAAEVGGVGDRYLCIINGQEKNFGLKREDGLSRQKSLLFSKFYKTIVATV